MLDTLINGLLGADNPSKAAPPEKSSVEISIPKDHPGLPRLYKATMRMPKVTVQQQNGVSYTKDGLFLPGIVEEFFDALAAIIGEEQVNAIEEQFGLHNALSDSTRLGAILPNLLPLINLASGLVTTEA